MSKGNIATSLLSTTLRGMAGVNSNPALNKPEKMLQLYDIENCPHCRLVREVLTELDLDAEIYPCPKSGTRYRPEVLRRGGKSQFPYLVDPNTGQELYESLEIVAYLYKTYGGRPVPLKWRLGKLQTFSSMLASAPRALRGLQVKAVAQSPEYMLELYSFESSPYARPVRELLCAMEIAYIVRSCGRTELEDWLLPPLREALKIRSENTSGNRGQLLLEQGKVSIPFLYDPNTQTGLFESVDILDYLSEQYG